RPHHAISYSLTSTSNAAFHPFSSQHITFTILFKRGSHHEGQQNVMAKFPTVRIRTRRKYYQLIFTFLMALMMSTIISTALLLINVGFVEGFFTTLFHSWKYAFMV